MILAPIFAALALATGTLIEKIILTKKKVSIKFYETGQFFAITLVMLPIIFFFWKVTPEALELKNILILVGVIILSIFANYFTFFALKNAKLSKIEPAKITEPLFVILFAILFSFLISPDLYERSTHVVVPALIAGAALIFSHVKKHHLKFSKPFLYALLGSFLFALELVLSRLILDYYNGVTFYFIRCTLIFFIVFLIFRPKLIRTRSTKTLIHMLIAAAVWVIYRVIVYYGYVNMGVISTTAIIMLGPIFIYLFAWKFLKEKLTWRNIIASFVILGCVLYIALV